MILLTDMDLKNLRIDFLPPAKAGGNLYGASFQ
jgi:hypothetical protein